MRWFCCILLIVYHKLSFFAKDIRLTKPRNLCDSVFFCTKKTQSRCQPHAFLEKVPSKNNLPAVANTPCLSTQPIPGLRCCTAGPAHICTNIASVVNFIFAIALVGSIFRIRTGFIAHQYFCIIHKLPTYTAFQTSQLDLQLCRSIHLHRSRSFCIRSRIISVRLCICKTNDTQ